MPIDSKSKTCPFISDDGPFCVVGVLFTQDPLTQNPAVITINANYGLGEVSSHLETKIKLEWSH